MDNILLAICIIGFFFIIFIVTTILNQNYKKDVNVRGFVGNCEKCSSFSCHKHPKHDEEMNKLEEMYE